MERKLASIQKIINITPIEGADAIEVAQILGWKVVIKKGEFQIGDLCVYCEIDSVLPEKPEFEFLRKNKFRIKTIRLRGQISQGIAFPTNILSNNSDFSEGQDVTNIMGIVKYDPPEIGISLAGVAKGTFPGHSEKTDEERIQSMDIEYSTLKQYKFFCTEKLDGTSFTAILKDGTFEICSRNLNLLETDGNKYWQVAREMKIEEKLREISNILGKGYENITLQGEMIGEGIQGNKYKLKGQTIKFFRLFQINSSSFIQYNTFISVLKTVGLDTVPILNNSMELPETMDELIQFADGSSMLNDNTNREGIVLVNDSLNHSGRFSFKVISNKFLLKNEV